MESRQTNYACFKFEYLCWRQVHSSKLLTSWAVCASYTDSGIFLTPLEPSFDRSSGLFEVSTLKSLFLAKSYHFFSLFSLLLFHIETLAFQPWFLLPLSKIHPWFCKISKEEVKTNISTDWIALPSKFSLDIHFLVSIFEVRVLLTWYIYDLIYIYIYICLCVCGIVLVIIMYEMILWYKESLINK